MAKHKKQSKKPAPPKRKKRPWGILGAFAVVVGVACILWWASTPEPPGASLAGLTSGSAAGFNVLLITLDTTRADHIGCYGYAGAETAVIDHLAAEGIRFVDAVAVVPLTLPSHTSILTGLYPPHHGVRHNGEFRLEPSHVTLAEVLRKHGYQTAAFTSAFVVDARYGLDQGFDTYDDSVDTASGEAFGYYDERSATAVTTAALNWFQQRDPTKPFFTWVHYFDPHTNYDPPQPFASRFRHNPYDGEIAYVDTQIQRLVARLKDADLWNRTLIVVLGDHGESLGEHHESTHGRLVYDAAIRVPLILTCPGLFRGPYVVDNIVAATTDVFPTVLDLLGIESGARCDGVSLLRVATGTDRTIYIETMATYLDNGWAPLHGLRRHRDKYILAPTPEYYNLDTDPNELRNLYTSPSRQAARAIATLSTELEALMSQWPSAGDVLSAAQPVDPETVRRLESLGYVSAPSPDGSVGELDPKEMMPTWDELHQSQRLAASGDYEAALAKAEQIYARSPRDRSVLRHLGELYWKMGRPVEAEQSLRRCQEIKPNVGICLLLAQMALQQGRQEEVDVLLTQAASLDPHHGLTYIVRGDLMVRRRQIDAALELYEQAKRVDPYRATAMAEARIAEIHERMSRHP